MDTSLKSTKVFAGRYEVKIEGYKPFVIRQALNNNCVPNGDWQLLYDGEWMDTLPSKKDCLDALTDMVKSGNLNYYIGA